MTVQHETKPRDPIERLNHFTSRAQMIGAAACTLVGFLPGAIVLGAGAALDIAGNNFYKDMKQRHLRRSIGAAATATR